MTLFDQISLLLYMTHFFLTINQSQKRLTDGITKKEPSFGVTA